MSTTEKLFYAADIDATSLPFLPRQLNSNFIKTSGRDGIMNDRERHKLSEKSPLADMRYINIS